ncbi:MULTISPECIES: S-layer homology domain-containing protein [unclassified Paenibacillus]|uniref:S-layer homology domain-containing protein n=1 Tax=unclassified Paenibacillus TaxID=185978 RepID=UPI0009571865|nr:MULTISPECIES: S-layer homology domain-containing protein [unclassified Paenibacillus]ASS68809.2 S-layer homology domain-containing protein [Paenibacillus sp. RUD330]SIR58119.1 S-layer homology domain-containing protein [Paenibacillus sp. RU4X]SIR66866.1 S-layer homology domain-containing protein [Paenibacillus sp. RU4T]
MKLSKLTTGLTAAALLFSSVSASMQAAPATAASTSFKDVKSSDWYYSSIQKLIMKELVNGFEDGTFKPNKEISRAEFLKLVDLSLQLDIPANLPGKPWYTPYISAAVEAGIHNTSDFNGNWAQPINRQEMARITVRAVDQTLRNTKTSDSQLVYEATKRGILSGLTGGELGLKENSTRAQAMVIVDRVLTVLSGGSLTADKRAASFAEVAFRGTNVETMWGGVIRPFPFTEDISPYAKGTFKQMLVIDLADKNSPYRNLVPSLIRADGNSWSSDYLLAFNVVMAATKTLQNTERYLREMISNPYMNFAAIYPLNSESKLNKLETLKIQKNSKTEIWHLVTVDKKNFTNIKNGNWPFLYFDWSNKQNKIFFEKEGRIFGGGNN